MKKKTQLPVLANTSFAGILPYFFVLFECEYCAIFLFLCTIVEYPLCLMKFTGKCCSQGRRSFDTGGKIALVKFAFSIHREEYSGELYGKVGTQQSEILQSLLLQFTLSPVCQPDFFNIVVLSKRLAKCDVRQLEK